MATTSHPGPSFDITAADDMDLYSDNGGLEYNDGDIDLDLEPPPDGPDDDVSIDDAVSANGTDAHADDNDDYMIDQEDVIEEDYSYEDVDVDVDTVAEQSVAADTITTETQVEVQDEDLLDYSEDENGHHNPELDASVPWAQQHDSLQEQPEQTQDISGQQDESVQTQDAPIEQGETHEVQDATIQQDEIPADLQAPMSMNTNKNSQSPQAHTDVVADDSLNAENHENSPRPESAGPTEGDDQANDNDGGVLLRPQGEHATTESGHNGMSNLSHDHDESTQTQDSEHQEDASLQLPPVTVNYMGEELWLFKQHDYENSGDWLLEDASVANTSMSDLFQACRSALGNEVLNGMEIGFRFDHFQNMELFEDNTACVAVSLERLVGYYHVLYAQDGNNDPDSFYITLMYRPRFATLLADIARYADNGRGYSGFEVAVAAGETNFHSASLGLPVEETTGWETEGQDPEQEHEQEQVNDDEQESEHEHERDAGEQTHEEDANEKRHEEDLSEKNAEDQIPQNNEVEVRAEDQQEPEQQAPEQQEQAYEAVQDYENGESEYQEVDDTQDAHEEGGVGIYEDEGVTAEDASGEVHEERNDEEQPPSSYEVSASAHEVADEPEQIRSQSEDKTAAELEARRLQQEGDIIDYSDGEDEDSATVEEVEQAPRAELSPSPATVQGDESTNVEKQASVEVSQGVGQQTNGENGADSFDTADNPDTNAEQDFDLNGDAEYWAFIADTEAREASEERSPSDESQPQTVGEDDVALEHQGDADQDYEVYEYQDLEQHAEGELEFANEEEINGGEDGNEFTGTNDVLDLDEPQWVANPELGQDAVEETTTTHEVDHIDIQDEEDGVAEHIASATSSAAAPTTASSTEANEVSPQGHKRSIDEVGHGPDLAPDSIDAKRARV